MKKSLIETITGFSVLIIASWFFIYAYTTNSTNSTGGGYYLLTHFQNVEGIVKGSDVMTAGIKVGEVDSILLDQNNFSAIVRLKIQSKIKLPLDSQASVVSSGFLGGKFIAITPGSDSNDLADNDVIKFTQSSVNLESLLGKFMYSFQQK